MFTNPWEGMLAKFMIEVASAEQGGTVVVGRKPRSFTFIFLVLKDLELRPNVNINQFY